MTEGRCGGREGQREYLCMCNYSEKSAGERRKEKRTAMKRETVRGVGFHHSDVVQDSRMLSRRYQQP